MHSKDFLIKLRTEESLSLNYANTLLKCQSTSSCVHVNAQREILFCSKDVIVHHDNYLHLSLEVCFLGFL